MRGEPEGTEGMFSYITPAQRVPKDCPQHSIKAMVDAALKERSPTLQKVHSRIGRPSTPPERLIRASVQQMLYSIRSERQLMEQLNFNILCRWLVGDRVWGATVYTKNRRRPLDGRGDVKFFEAILKQAKDKGLLSEEHFTVDGTLIEAWQRPRSVWREDSALVEELVGPPGVEDEALDQGGLSSTVSGAGPLTRFDGR